MAQHVRYNFNRSFGKKQVIAYNLFTCATGGDPLFYGECIYGTNNQLRGYVAGQYIDRYMIATQLEYRLALPWRFGMVAFGGLGEMARSVGQFRYSNFLPAGGGGLRFELSTKYNVNLRADIAQGKDESPDIPCRRSSKPAKALTSAVHSLERLVMGDSHSKLA